MDYYEVMDEPFSQWIQDHFIANDPILISLIKKAHQIENTVFYACEMESRRMLYISRSCERMLGYTPEQFTKGGAEFFYGITDPVMIPSIIERQLTYIRQSKSGRFNPRSIMVQEYPVRMITAEKKRVDIVSMAVVLTYYPTGDWGFGVAMLMKPDEDLQMKCRQMLISIKRRHNKIYKHPQIVGKVEVLPVIHTINERIDKKISKREAQVIARLAEGLSSIAIGKSLNISVNTVETHRRKLLKKFNAKNTAELIKKASKTFWLE